MNALIKPVLFTTVVLGGMGMVFMTLMVWSLVFHATVGSP